MLLKPVVGGAQQWFVFEGLDKIVHFLIFLLLGFTFKTAFPRTSISLFLIIMLVYAILTEILQHTMQLGRSMEFLDLVADSIGVIVGYFIFQKMKKNTN